MWDNFWLEQDIFFCNNTTCPFYPPNVMSPQLLRICMTLWSATVNCNSTLTVVRHLALLIYVCSIHPICKIKNWLAFSILEKGLKGHHKILWQVNLNVLKEAQRDSAKENSFAALLLSIREVRDDGRLENRAEVGREKWIAHSLNLPYPGEPGPSLSQHCQKDWRSQWR